MYDYQKLSELMERIGNKYNQFENKKHRNYGGVTLTHREIHTIACIGDHPGLNLTTLAARQGITKSAASQMINRLRKKELVTKKMSTNSEAEIEIALTSIGEIVYTEHQEYHKNANNQFLNLLEQVPEETAKQMEEVLVAFDQALDSWIEK